MTSDWLPGLGPWTPVIRDGKLYGRGGADDGYSIFAALTAIRVVKEQVITPQQSNIKHMDTTKQCRTRTRTKDKDMSVP
jgi:acetylornithine deacetylase/succinyl-diaminopimelate desuccinylase-like protein